MPGLPGGGPDRAPDGLLGRLPPGTEERMTSKGFDQVIRTPGYVAQLELGLRKNPSLDVVRRLARALGVRLSELLG